jgi:N utilization substance protein B
VTEPSRTNRSSRRREARERAIELAYEAQVRDVSVDVLLSGLPLPPDDFTVDLLRYEEQVRAKAEELIAARASGWALDRMPLLDLIVMRLATAELLTQDTPIGVVLSQAVELASRYSTDESGRFVNGVLAAIANDVRP